MAFCLEVPAGFPPVVLRGAPVQPGQEAALQLSYLNEDAEVTGFFFKSWVYLTDSSTISAPLLLVRSPNWQPPAVATPRTPETTSTTFMTIVGIASFCALVVVVLVFVRGRTIVGRDRAQIDPDEVGQALQLLPEDEIHPPTRESLRQLSKQPLESSAEEHESSDQGYRE